jgi:diacylglycerol kinase (ATP)
MKKFVAGFKFAFNGLWLYLRSGRNVNVHIMATILVIFVAWWLKVSDVKWVLLVLLITLVHMAEAFNTAIEKLVDKVSPEYHPLAGQIKDLAAGAVLLSAIGAAAGGLILLLPPLITKLGF